MTEEIWDLLDVDANPTGETHVRDTPIPEGRMHLVVAAAVVRRDGRILVAQRAAEKTFPFAWEISAGSALAGETSREAASRELYEEVGVRCEPSDLTPIGRVIEPTAFFDLYATVVDGDVDIVLDPDEVADARWVTFDEFDRMTAAGELADPWIHRLQQFRPALGEFVATAVGS
ncbi:NUDIX hydrolase [Microbacterium nanhaiense]|uniref:8-oxo-dGTP diphosphatase n=1 Tax=Microbacterium nanhaiense TaxID=1301026 RepID=A0ABQ2MYK3_9MICO|nr:NUDIX domain-containing protein [Microbacterium nanhaiense]GGO61960.1 NUDIX hydrolase [Microbacterium nanhaiense]